MAVATAEGVDIDKRWQTRVHEALEAHGGSRARAAESLGITKERLKNTIYNCPDLRARWGQDEAKAPDEIDAIAREPITPNEERLAQRYAEESKRFVKSLGTLPLNEKEANLALALQQFNQGHFKELLDISNAAMGMMVLKVLSRVETIQKRLEDVTEALNLMGGEMTEERIYLAQEEKSLSDQYIQAVDALRKIQEANFAGSKTLALIKYRIRQGVTKKAKPGFQPTGEVLDV